MTLGEMTRQGRGGYTNGQGSHRLRTEELY
jgi:hypothetical protein